MDPNHELVIVALAAEDDVVQQYSSDKAPHMTLLYLGDPKFSPVELANVTDYIEHAASQISCFGMEVESRGELGAQKADVLFFVKRYAKQIEQFRGNLRQNELINRAFLSVDQFPAWIPHLTMGFPETPAKKDTREYQRYSRVRFDRIALWTGDSIGPTFQLKSDSYGLEVAMSQAERGAELVAELFHYGVPGMKWGQHKKSSSVPAGTVKVDVNKKGRPVATGGHGFKLKEEAARKVATQQVARKSGVHALSNKELQDAVTRMNLEQQFVRLSPQSKSKKVKKFIAETLLGIGKQQATQAANTVASQQVAAVLAKAKK